MKCNKCRYDWSNSGDSAHVCGPVKVKQQEQSVSVGEPVACKRCIELGRLCDATYVAEGADAYNHACDEMERWQEQRYKAGKEVGTTGSLCDGISWLYSYIDQLEALAKQEHDEMVSKARYNRLRDDYNEAIELLRLAALAAKKWEEHVNRCQLQGVDLDHNFALAKQEHFDLNEDLKAWQKDGSPIPAKQEQGEPVAPNHSNNSQNSFEARMNVDFGGGAQKQEQSTECVGEPVGTAGELFTNTALERLDFRPSTKIYTTPYVATQRQPVAEPHKGDPCSHPCGNIKCAVICKRHSEQEQGEPLFWYRPVGEDGLYEGPIHNASIERVRKECGTWKPLYTTPQQRKPLTDELADALKTVLKWVDDFCETDEHFAESVEAKADAALEKYEAAHGIKE